MKTIIIILLIAAVIVLLIGMIWFSNSRRHQFTTTYSLSTGDGNFYLGRLVLMSLLLAGVYCIVDIGMNEYITLTTWPLVTMLSSYTWFWALALAVAIVLILGNPISYITEANTHFRFNWLPFLIIAGIALLIVGIALLIVGVSAWGGYSLSLILTPFYEASGFGITGRGIAIFLWAVLGIVLLASNDDKETRSVVLITFLIRIALIAMVMLLDKISGMPSVNWPSISWPSITGPAINWSLIFGIIGAVILLVLLIWLLAKARWLLIPLALIALIGLVAWGTSSSFTVSKTHKTGVTPGSKYIPAPYPVKRVPKPEQNFSNAED